MRRSLAARLLPLPVLLVADGGTPARADSPPGCWPHDVPVPADLAEVSSQAPCAPVSMEGADVTSWRFRSSPGRWAAEMRRALSTRGYRLSGLRRVRGSAWDREGALSFTARRGERPARGARFRTLSFFVRRPPGGAAVVIYDADLEGPR